MLLAELFATTLRNQTELNPELWDDDRLKPEVRAKLLAFGDAFADFCKVPAELRKDVLLVGGSAGYNWTDFSDIDVHVLAPRGALGPREVVDELLAAKKKLWSLSRSVTVKGHPLEGYIQDPDETLISQGVYSLNNDEWVRHATRSGHSWTTDEAFESKVENLMSVIDHMIAAEASPAEFSLLLKRIVDMRRAGLADGGEYSVENKCFKELRTQGFLTKITSYLRSKEDEELSLR